MGAAPWRNTCRPHHSNAGALEHKPATSTINCTVSGVVEDSMDNILGKVHEAGLTLKAGCGIGYEFSTLRPKGAFVAGAGAYTSGPLLFCVLIKSLDDFGSDNVSQVAEVYCLQVHLFYILF